MIVPGKKLLWWTAAIVLPWLAAAYLVPLPVLAAVLGIFSAIVLFDSIAGLARPGVKVDFPETVRLTRGREGAIEFFAHTDGPGYIARAGLPFPPEIEAVEDMAFVLEKGAVHSFKWACKAGKRGRYQIENCYLEIPSPLGLWAVRRQAPLNMELCVYPNMLEERGGLSALFLRKGNFGARPQRTVGQGRDFEKLREYIHGDSYDQIHWKVTAKRGRPVTKVFQIERTQEVYVVVDASRLSGRPDRSVLEENGIANRNILDRFISGALVLGLAAKRQGDLFGLLTYNDKVAGFMRAKTGQGHFKDCREALYALESKPVNPDLGDVFSFISTKIRRRSLLVFLTSLDDPIIAGDFLKNAALISRRHLVLVAMIAPEGIEPLFSGTDASSPDDVYKGLGGHIYWSGLMELQKSLGQRGVRFSLVKPGDLSTHLVSRYMEIKERQLI